MSLLFVLASLAMAQDTGSANAGFLDNNIYQPPIETDGMLWTEDAGIGPAGLSHATVQSNYVFDPLTETGPDNDYNSTAQALRTDLILAAAMGGWQVGVDVPTYSVNNSSPLNSAAEFGLGDLGIDAKIGVVEFGQDNPANIGVGARLILPTTSPGIFEAGTTDAVAWEARLVGDVDIANRFKLAGNIGTRGLPDEVVNTDNFNNQFFFRAGAAADLARDFGLNLEVAGAFDYDTPIDEQLAPVQGSFGAYGRIARDLVLRGGVGSGWIPGTEGPQNRLLFGISWDPGHPSRREEALKTAARQEPAESAEERPSRWMARGEREGEVEPTAVGYEKRGEGRDDDRGRKERDDERYGDRGREERDDERYGERDREDHEAHHEQARREERWQERGEEPRYREGRRISPVAIRVRDSAGNLVANANVRIERNGELMYTGDGSFDARLEPGTYVLTAASPGYTPLKTEFQVFPGDSVQIAAVLTGSQRLDPDRNVREPQPTSLETPRAEPIHTEPVHAEPPKPATPPAELEPPMDEAPEAGDEAPQ